MANIKSFSDIYKHRLAEDAEAPQEYNYHGGGVIGEFVPSSISSALFRNQPSTPPLVHAPSQEHRYSIEGLFTNDLTIEDLTKIEDQMLLDDQLVTGHFELNLIPKHRFTFKAETSNSLAVKPLHQVIYTDYFMDKLKIEDELLVLGESSIKTTDDDDELKLLGVL